MVGIVPKPRKTDKEIAAEAFAAEAQKPSKTELIQIFKDKPLLQKLQNEHGQKLSKSL